jgi:hypothetical protein
MLRFHGAWRITVLARDADFEQRAVVRGAYGTRVVPGRPGATLQVDEESWTLSLEHLAWGRAWQPNLRTTCGPVTEHGGVRSQVLTSNDHHFAGKPLDYANLVLRLDQVVGIAPGSVRAVRATGVPGAPQAIRTTSSTHTASDGRPAQAHRTAGVTQVTKKG